MRARAAAARWVLHLDMDAFFAAVEQLTRPTLRDRPVLVGGLGPRGVVAGASYQARRFGARSAMPMGQARRRCPHAVVLPPRGRLYHALSEQVMEVLADFAPVVEPVSLDEAFLEPPALAGAGAAEVASFATSLRVAVRARTGLPASVGAGSGKQLAKIASELAKPDGLRVLTRAEEQPVLGPLPVRALWGVGPVAEAALARLGVRTVGELAAMDLRELTGLLGVAVGTELHRLARGVDDRPVSPRGAAKQVSAETTFDTDLTAMSAVHDAVARMTEAAHRRLTASGRAARTVTVKVRSAGFTTSSRSETAADATADLAALTAVAQRLARAAVPDGGVRLIGVSLAGLSDTPPPALFEPPSAGEEPGARAVLRASGAMPEAATSPGPPRPREPDPHQQPPAAGAASAPGGDPSAPDTPRGGGQTTADPDRPGAARGPAPTRVPPVGDGGDTSGDTGGDTSGDTGGDTGSADVAAPGRTGRTWRAGDDVRHPDHGHGWVQGAGHGRVTVRFETRGTGPGRARTLRADDPDLQPADPLDSLA